MYGSVSDTTVPEIFSIKLNGQTFNPRKSVSWKTHSEGVQLLIGQNRIFNLGKSLYYKIYFNDFPLTKLTNLWTDTRGEVSKIYVVQTSEIIVQRCMLMTTDPGDLVLDPTCGGGTTAYLAEQWGRRWITCDTSRVALALAKQRIMTGVFDYYSLARPAEGVTSGFQYKKVPHITLGALANKEAPKEEILYHQPLIDKGKKRVTGPFTVEAVPSPQVISMEQIEKGTPEPDVNLARSGETLRLTDWIDELRVTGIRGKSGQKVEFARVEPLAASRHLHAEGETKEKEPKRVVISFGSPYAPLEQRQVELAIEESQTLVPKPKMIVFSAFQFDPEAAKDIDELDWPGVTVLKVQMNTDLMSADLKKKRSGNEPFWLIGQPDIELRKDGQRFVVEVNGFDYYNPTTGEIESGDMSKISIWMLDTDYDGRSLYPRQVFFPMAGMNEGWDTLAKNLKGYIDAELIENYKGNKSLPFKLGSSKRIAVKIIDDRGIESLRIIEAKE